MGNKKEENFLKGYEGVMQKRDKCSYDFLKTCIYHVGEGNEGKVVKRNFKEKINNFGRPYAGH